MKKVYIEHPSQDYRDLFQVIGFAVVDSPDNADLICFTGGADVSSAYYGDKQHPATFSDHYRDAKEERIFLSMLDKKKAMVGICRGAQFLNVMSGGRMYQDVTDHTRSHYLTDVETGEVVYVSSTHHQMMLPSLGGKVLAYGNHTAQAEWYDGAIIKRSEAVQSVEVVHYAGTHCLCFQPHPEFDDTVFDGMRNYFAGLLEKLL